MYQIWVRNGLESSESKSPQMHEANYMNGGIVDEKRALQIRGRWFKFKIQDSLTKFFTLATLDKYERHLNQLGKVDTIPRPGGNKSLMALTGGTCRGRNLRTQ